MDADDADAVAKTVSMEERMETLKYFVVEIERLMWFNCPTVVKFSAVVEVSFFPHLIMQRMNSLDCRNFAFYL